MRADAPHGIKTEAARQHGGPLLSYATLKRNLPSKAEGMSSLSPQIRYFCRFIFWLPLLLVCSVALTPAQTTKKQAKPSAFCQRDDTLELIEQQLAQTKLIDDPVKRIAVLLRASDLLWTHRQDRSRAGFTEALELATQNYKEKGDKPYSAGIGLIVQPPDQRYTVISAIAKRDLTWARKLSDQMLKDEAKEAEEKATRDPREQGRTAEKLLGAAFALLKTDQSAALGFARTSLQYPATLSLSRFLYDLAEVNEAAADQLYREALAAYADAPMDQLLYLSSYPFGSNREAGEMPSWTYYVVPARFTPDPGAQRLLVQTLLRRAQQMIENPATVGRGVRFSESEQLWMAFTRLEGQVGRSVPDLVEGVRQARVSISSLLDQKDRQRVERTVATRPKKSFEQLVGEAERLADPARREAELAMAILDARNEPLEQVEEAAAKIDNVTLRDGLLNWLYFDRAQAAIKERRIEEARRLAGKVSELDQRAYLYSRIAEESLKQTRIETEARELLEEVLGAAEKAPDTEVKARTLLAVAHLYTRFDPHRSLTVLSGAVKSINHIDAPDFSRDYVQRKVEGQSFGSYAAMYTPGFNPENGFREIGKFDYEGALSLAANIADKPLRALTTLALAELCLQSAPQPRKPERRTPKAAGL